MKKLILIISLSFTLAQLHSQNSIGIQMGFLGTHTRIAEYERIDRHDYLLDSMDISPTVGSFQAALTLDLDLGKRFFLSPGFHYSNKGLSNVTFIDSTGWPWQTSARQHYTGLSLMIGYHIPLKQSKFGLQAATGFKADFAVGTPNGGALFSGPYYRFFMPFSRFNEVDLSWMTEAGVTYACGPGGFVLKVSYQYGLSDVLEDAFVVGRSMSFGATVGYSIHLSQ
jgi:hypothetical protein